MATTTGQVRPVRFDPPENVLSHHPHSPILMKSSTWTISLTPGVRRSVAPMMVVMASWIDSREYTFLMNPEVSHYVILSATRFPSCQHIYAIDQSSTGRLTPSLFILPAQLCNPSIKCYQLTKPDHLAGPPILQLIHQALQAY